MWRPFAEEVQRSIGGKVSPPGDAAYDDAVNIWNGAITRRPALVASCASSGDVAVALVSPATTGSRCRCGGVATTTPGSR
jgi:hypothetical protein